jgi:hypothetical protein
MAGAIDEPAKIFYDACKMRTDILATVGISNNRKSALMKQLRYKAVEQETLSSP